MPNKKKFPKGKLLPSAALFIRSNADKDDDSDIEREECRAWVAERDRQKAASREAEALLARRRTQTAVLLGEENDFRTNLTATEKTVRAHLEDALSEVRIEREWIEFTIARREEREQEERAKKAAITPLATQQMLHRADIADKETENRASFFNSFAESMNRAKETEKARLAEEKLEASRKKAAERAKAFRAQERTTEHASLFQLVDAPAESTAESKAPEKGGIFSKWFSRN